MLSYSIHSLDTVKEGFKQGNPHVELLLANQAGKLAKVKSWIFKKKKKKKQCYQKVQTHVFFFF